jgi:uncharacterized YigZ family protein
LNFKTVYGYGEGVVVIEKSKFIGYCKPISTEEEAVAFIEEIKKKHWDARHNVPVYVIGEKYDVQRYTDDGEPSGTAGIPILSMLKNEGITNVVIVVTRYFGGVKLGTGGLVRAYTKGAKIALDSAIVIEKINYKKIALSVSYHLHGKVKNYIQNDETIIVEDELFTENVKLLIYIDPEKEEKYVADFMNLTGGDVKISDEGLEYLKVKDGKILD